VTKKLPRSGAQDLIPTMTTAMAMIIMTMTVIVMMMMHGSVGDDNDDCEGDETKSSR
jgi:hypothetical protein